MIDNVESRVRCLVAEFLGVDASDLGPEISLTDDLAADSLDLLELVLALEGRFGIAIPEAVIDGMHRYGDLVDVVEALAAEQHAPAGAEAPLVWARVVPGPDHGEVVMERAGTLTPYQAEDIADDALHAGPGAQLEMCVPTATSDLDLARLEGDFAWLERRGIRVSVRRDRAVDAAGGQHPHAA